ncbi:3-methyladenine DNA glycosylase [Gemmatimonas sp.]
MTVLSTAEWQVRSASHLARVQRHTQPRRERRSRGAVHPVYDFLFQYYSYSAGKLEAWHPSPHEGVEDSPAARARFCAPLYEAHAGVVRRSAHALSRAERETLRQVRQVLCDTRERAANFGCYGLHEWAMVYGGHDVRHAGIAPLRLPQEQIDALVSQRPVACSHFDAFRFFAPAAKPLNRLPLAWATRYDAEQPGCIHANMDLYRWAYTAMPHIGSDLLADCFELAVELRELDMRASPYDLRALGFAPVCIETPEGREEYQRHQRALSARAAVLRDALIDTLSGFTL